MSVSEDGSFFVLVGLRTVRFCQFDAELSHRSRRVNSVVSRTAVLGAHQSLNYIAVCCSKSKLGVTANDRQTKTYVLSQRGKELGWDWESCINSMQFYCLKF